MAFGTNVGLHANQHWCKNSSHLNILLTIVPNLLTIAIQFNQLIILVVYKFGAIVSYKTCYHQNLFS
jgi:hypothetical protein